MADVKNYLIWPDHPAEFGMSSFQGHLITGCERAGGDYIISWDDADWIRAPRGVRLRGERLNRLRARLTTLLVDQRNHGEPSPVVTRELIERASQKRALPIYERANRLLRFIGEQTAIVGKEYDTRRDNLAAYAWSESLEPEELSYLTDYLITAGLLATFPNIAKTQVGNYSVPAIVIVTVAGHSQIEQRESNTDSSQAFIAMWFHDSTTEAFEKGIKPAVEAAGYESQRIDRKEHINKIDDEIMGELRRSRFLVADFTHGEDGARGGVYYEAGFAHGLGIPVIFTCHEGDVETLYFDTSHYNHIVWTTPEDLRYKLKNRILAVIGDGPELNHNP